MKKTVEFLESIKISFNKVNQPEAKEIVNVAKACLDEIIEIKAEIAALYIEYRSDIDPVSHGICQALDWCEQILENYEEWKGGE